MSAEFVSMLIYAALAVLAGATVQAIVYRLIFVHRTCRMCRTDIFCKALTCLRRMDGRQDSSRFVDWLRKQSGLGWLGALPRKDSWTGIASAIEICGQKSQTHLATLHGAATLGPLFGLFGTVAGFLFSDQADGGGLGLAFRTTMFGIGIAIPAYLYQCLNAGWQANLDKQIADIESAVARVAALRPAVIAPKKPINSNGRVADSGDQATAAPLIVNGFNDFPVDSHILEWISAPFANFVPKSESGEQYGTETLATAFFDPFASDGGRVCDRGSGLEPAEPDPPRPLAASQSNHRRRDDHRNGFQTHHVGNPDR